ncbi:DUF883 family protein [Pseudomonas typographi]|uniref:DUF883 family protein n=1 Tax=Pseudomonas typographi TaxID=2715964 RepID=A0ABR7Z616_9PSED|nr:DUF883 family protein [Pseudomonas typographi]MBD1554320.1 DUF883 family protein [Pseudomonas typographi]MBD1589548.1 DUF883 family protein [Pseudomonas typographi]MBD1600928.1 DUF883 family protein [Pseudomonas typographi]
MARKSSAASAGDQIKDQAFSELAALIEESEKLLKDSAALVGDEAETLRAQITEKLRKALESVDGVRSKAQPALEATQDYIGGHPLQTVAIAAGVGLVIGVLIGKR